MTNTEHSVLEGSEHKVNIGKHELQIREYTEGNKIILSELQSFNSSKRNPQEFMTYNKP